MTGSVNVVNFTYSFWIGAFPFDVMQQAEIFWSKSDTQQIIQCDVPVLFLNIAMFAEHLEIVQSIWATF